MQFLRAPRKLAGQGYEVSLCTGSAQECSRVSLENLRRSAGRGTLVQSVCSFGTLMIMMEPGIDARPLIFLPLFTQVLRVLAGRTITFSERQYATYRELLARGS